MNCSDFGHEAEGPLKQRAAEAAGVFFLSGRRRSRQLWREEHEVLGIRKCAAHEHPPDDFLSPRELPHCAFFMCSPKIQLQVHPGEECDISQVRVGLFLNSPKGHVQPWRKSAQRRRFLLAGKDQNKGKKKQRKKDASTEAEIKRKHSETVWVLKMLQNTACNAFHTS